MTRLLMFAVAGLHQQALRPRHDGAGTQHSNLTRVRPTRRRASNGSWNGAWGASQPRECRSSGDHIDRRTVSVGAAT